MVARNAQSSVVTWLVARLPAYGNVPRSRVRVYYLFLGRGGGVCVRVCYACRCRVEGRTKSHVGLGMEQGISAG